MKMKRKITSQWGEIMQAISWYAIMLWYFMYLFVGFRKCNVRNTVQWNKIRNCGKVWRDRISFRNNGGLYSRILYKYYIPERVIVRMFTLRKWLSTEAKPRSIIIFEGGTFLLLPSQECTIYFIIPKLLSGKSRYVKGAGEEVSPKLLKFQNVQLYLIKKTSTHTWWFHSQTAESQAF